MIVLADIDGVIASFVDAYLDTLRELYGLSFTLEDVTDWSFSRALGITEAQDVSIWESPLLAANMAKAPVLPGGRRALDAHFAAGDTVVYGTARGTGANGQAAAQMKADRELTPHYLASNGFLPAGTDIIYSGDKLGLANYVNPGLCYEDAPHNVLQLAEAGFPVVMPVFGYNRHVPAHPLITRVEGWHLP